MSTFSRLGYSAGDDQRRAGELIAAHEDPAVDAIVAARGGCGAMRILEAVGVERVKRAGKLLGALAISQLCMRCGRVQVCSLCMRRCMLMSMRLAGVFHKLRGIDVSIDTTTATLTQTG